MTQELARKEMSLPYGVLHVLDEGYELTAEFLDQHLRQGFIRSPHYVRILSGFDIADAMVVVKSGTPELIHNSARAVEIPLQIDSGVMFIGSSSEWHDGIIDLELTPGNYLVTVSQETILETALGQSAKLEFLIYVNPYDGPNTARVLVADEITQKGNELVPPGSEEYFD